MSFNELIAKLVENNSSSSTVRSQALKPLLQMMALVASSSVLLMVLGPTTWVQIVGAVLLVVFVTFSMWAFWYFARKDPDRLGSEAFITQSRMLKYAEKAKNPSILSALPDLLEDPAPPKVKRALPARIKTDRGAEEGES